MVPVGELVPHPKNPKKHSKEAIKRQAEVLEYQGWRRPITVSNLSGRMTTGHKRLYAAQLLKEPEVPVSFQDYENEDQEIADLVADNALNEWELTDLKDINALIPELGPDFNIDMLGLKDFVIEPADKYGNPDEVPEVKEAICKTGELWLLGDHRLLVGDCTVKENVERLMGGEKADLFLTDPPYGVDYSSRQEMMNEWGKKTGLRGGNKSITTPIQNDGGTIDETGSVWLAAYINALLASSDKASFYIFSPQGGDLMMMMMMIDQAGWTLKHMLVWVKNNHVLGRCDYHYKHEPIFYGWNKGHDFYGANNCVSVLEFDRERKNDLHPTMKPVELLAVLVTNSSLTGARILDPFLGSGSTLIACEKTNRRCFGMEIDPHYCDVIIARWEKFTGKKATLST